MIVYAISVNGAEKYIGITRCSLEKRWREHKCAARCGNENPLYRAMRKYGFENCEIYQIASCFDQEGLYTTERQIIDERGTIVSCGGYNVTAGGRGPLKHATRFGEESHSAKLTEELVRYIRDPELIDVSNQELCDIAWADFDIIVSRDAIRDARRGDTWRHIDVQPIMRGQGRPSRSGRVAHTENAKRIFNDPVNREKCKIAMIKRRGKPNKANCKLTPCQVILAAFSEDSARSLAKKFGVDKATISNVRHRRIIEYADILGPL